MNKILNINITEKALLLFNMFDTFNVLNVYDKKQLIIDAVNQLRIDNKMKELNDEQFNFNCQVAGSWNEQKQEFSISYSNMNPDINTIIQTILHEFRHSWQYQNKENLDKLTQLNLEGYFNDKCSEYTIQPIEQDAFKFEYEATKYIAEQIENKELLEYAEHSYNNFNKTNRNNIKNIEKQKYKINEETLIKLFNFRKNRLQNIEEEPKFQFKYEKYNIQLTIKNKELYYAIINPIDKETDIVLSATCKENNCYINDFVYPYDKINTKDFNEILKVNEQIINYYNEKFNKNIEEIQFNLRFFEMKKSEHNKLIRSTEYKTKLFSFQDKYYEEPIKINLNDVIDKINNKIENTIDTYKTKEIINKIQNNEELEETEYFLIKQKYKELNSLENKEIYNILNKIKNKDINKISQNINQEYNEYIKFKNNDKLNNIIKNNTIKTNISKNIIINKEER